MKKIWANIVDSFEEAERFDENYYLKMPRSKRLETVQFLREKDFKIKSGLKGESRKRLRRVIKILQ